MRVCRINGKACFKWGRRTFGKELRCLYLGVARALEKGEHRG